MIKSAKTSSKPAHFAGWCPKIKYFIPLGVTFSQLSIIGTNLKLLVEAGVTNKGVTNKKVTELITSISFTDLQIIFDILDSQG